MPQTDENSPVAVSLIVAAARNGVIGKGGALPWHAPGDLRYFKRTTLGKPIIMGRKTWSGLRVKPLPGRLNIILSRRADADIAACGAEGACGAVIAAGLAQAIKLAKAEAAKTNQAEIFIIGGADVFAQALPLADKIYLTEIQANADGDAFFRPDLPPAQWQRQVLSPVQQGGGTAPLTVFCFISGGVRRFAAENRAYGAENLFQPLKSRLILPIRERNLSADLKSRPARRARSRTILCPGETRRTAKAAGITGKARGAAVRLMMTAASRLWGAGVPAAGVSLPCRILMLCCAKGKMA